MFGLSFGELTVVAIVALVVLGPHELPKVLRKLGQWAGKLRRMAVELRAQSGIDDVLRAEGIGEDLREITKLARGELDGVVASARLDSSGFSARTPTAMTAAAGSTAADPDPYARGGSGSYAREGFGHDAAAFAVLREREYPPQGPDHYGALPDTAVAYVEFLPPSPLANDPTYTQGIPTPPEPNARTGSPHEHSSASAEGGPLVARNDAENLAPVADDGFNVDRFATESTTTEAARAERDGDGSDGNGSGGNGSGGNVSGGREVVAKAEETSA